MTERPLRADARRNRERLLEVAMRAFSEQGPDATLDAIARTAGVGIGTLYRHFPTREALIEEVYRAELTRLCDAAPALLESLPPDEALRTWMDRFIEYLAAKRGLADALRVVIAAGGQPFAHSRERLVGALAVLLPAAGLDASSSDDVLMSLNGISLTAGDPAQRPQAARLLDLLMDGLRYRRTAPAVPLP
ncbi:TetR/AcrR family transcriptional regulator [Dactylosporangium sucinum]|uniref:TetR family transcriptional regulator n=1 Tax=Dactylosporangium sucinum TaxID=1424081 RepID=A0A917WRZ8_9ACTN|nr:TetR/AcrR family transcriptional regulator [Dactylosporangium sucinum]GGM24408.1 TetR family transcriptional regulator [Dactylosporangium sucinum]